MPKIIKMNLNTFSRLISTTTHTSTRHKLYNYFNNTPHLVFIDFSIPLIPRILPFPKVQRITIVGSKYDSVGSMINANLFPNLSYLRNIIDSNTSLKIVDKVEQKLINMTKFSSRHIDCDILYTEFNNSSHLDIKKISNNFSGFDVGGEINIKFYTQYLTEYIKETHSDYMAFIDSIHSEDAHLLQEVEELQLQKQTVLAETNREELH